MLLQAFVKELQDKGQAGDAVKDIIGQFGVGFYSVSCFPLLAYMPQPICSTICMPVRLQSLYEYIA
jgi:hypothetical protein